MLRAQLCTHINTASLYVVKAVLQAHFYTYINTDHFVYSKGSTAFTAVHVPKHCLFVYSKGCITGAVVHIYKQ